MTERRFQKGDIVRSTDPLKDPGLRYLVEDWKPGYISLVRARKNNKPDRRNNGFSGWDRWWELETSVLKGPR